MRGLRTGEAPGRCNMADWSASSWRAAGATGERFINALKGLTSPISATRVASRFTRRRPRTRNSLRRSSRRPTISRRCWPTTSDYSERELWPKYVEAYEDAIAFTRTKHAPWYVIPSNHKWFRNLAVSQIIADMGLKLPPSRVDIADIRRKYHAAKRETRGKTSKASR